jgi:formate hydrogenlyase subunit 3/multisubunit Na+/H+ antiporter MnhD subunit
VSLQILLMVTFGGALAAYLLAKISSLLRDACAAITSGLAVVIVAMLYDKTPAAVLVPSFAGMPLAVRLDMLSWFFAIAIAVVGFLSIIFSFRYIKDKERADFYYLMMMLVNAGMIGIVLSADLLTFYIFWEIMSWGAFLLISYNRGPALQAGMKYIVMSVAGSACYLIAILSLYTTGGTLTLSALAPALSGVSTQFVLLHVLLLCVAFGIKNAVLPFHTWLPDAHSEAPSPFSAVLSGILVRMGMYGFILAFFVIFTLQQFLGLGAGAGRFHHVLAWVGALNIIFPTFIAMLQNDSKRLLAWHGVGQGGYMVLGVALGTELGITGGIFHIVNHTSYIALLFLVVGAVEYRTGGVRDLNSLGGLAKRMPIVFIGALVGACGLIGLPLTNGFVSKWLIYKSLILDGYPFLAFAALVGTWGTILSLYKFIHNMFLGQLPDRYRTVRDAPPSMQVPIVVYAAIIVAFGIVPGIPLKVINAITVSLGLSSLDVTIWGIASDTGALNTINILSAVAATGIVVWIAFKAGRKSTRISQEDNYAAGAAIPAEKYSYTVNFYDPLYRMIRGYLRDVVDEFYYWIAGRVQALSDMVRRLYTGDVGTYMIYILLFVSVLVVAQIWWSPW